MYSALYEYLVLYRTLPIPGIGTFILDRKPAFTEFTQKQISPALYSVQLHQQESTPARSLFNWLGTKLGISSNDAVMRLNDFAFELKKQVAAGNKVIWNGVGTLSRTMTGGIRFDAEFQEHAFDNPVSAVRVIREKAVHTVRVGEEERTSEEMTEWLNPVAQTSRPWWTIPLILALVLLLATIIYFSQNGWNWSSSGSQKKVNTEKSGQPYELLTPAS